MIINTADNTSLSNTQVGELMYELGVGKSPFNADTDYCERYAHYCGMCLCCDLSSESTPVTGKANITSYVHSIQSVKDVIAQRANPEDARAIIDSIQKRQNRDINAYLKARKQCNPEKVCAECLGSTTGIALCTGAAYGPISFYSHLMTTCMEEQGLSLCEAFCTVAQLDPCYLGPASCALCCACVACKKIANV